MPPHRLPIRSCGLWVLTFEMKGQTQLTSKAGTRTQPVPNAPVPGARGSVPGARPDLTDTAGARCPVLGARPGARCPVPGARCPAGPNSPQSQQMGMCPAGPQSTHRPARAHGRCQVPGARFGARCPVPGARPGARCPVLVRTHVTSPAGSGTTPVPGARPNPSHLTGRLVDMAGARCRAPGPAQGAW